MKNIEMLKTLTGESRDLTIETAKFLLSVIDNGEIKSNPCADHPRSKELVFWTYLKNEIDLKIKEILANQE